MASTLSAKSNPSADSKPSAEFTLSADDEKKVDELLARYPTKRAAALPLLHLCQAQEGWIGPGIIDYVARRLELDASEVQGIVTFYTLYHKQPVAPNVIWVCRTLSCELRGARAIQQHLEKKLGCHVGGTSKDGKFTLLKAECLAACGQGPMVQINDAYFESLTLEKVDEVVAKIESGELLTRRVEMHGTKPPPPLNWSAEVPPHATPKAGTVTRSSLPPRPSVIPRSSDKPAAQGASGPGASGRNGKGE
jgi:NADH-quinone oxidoreductase subunit E